MALLLSIFFLSFTFLLSFLLAHFLVFVQALLYLFMYIFPFLFSLSTFPLFFVIIVYSFVGLFVLSSLLFHLESKWPLCDHVDHVLMSPL